MSQSPSVEGMNQIARFPIDHHLAGPINVKADNRFAGQQPMDEGSGETFPEAGVDDYIHGGHQAGNLLGRG